jgi:hypothetical protein
MFRTYSLAIPTKKAFFWLPGVRMIRRAIRICSCGASNFTKPTIITGLFIFSQSQQRIFTQQRSQGANVTAPETVSPKIKG